MFIQRRESGSHGVDAQMSRTGVPPPGGVVGKACRVTVAPADAPLHADEPRVATRFRGAFRNEVQRLGQPRTWRHHGKPAVSESAHPPVGGRGRPAHPHGDRALHGHRHQPGPADVVEVAIERDRPLRPESAQELYLLLHPATARRKVLPEGVVLDSIPPDADAEPQPALRQNVDLSRLLRNQRGLALRQDQNAGDELHRRSDAGQKTEQHEHLVEVGVYVVRAVPARVDVRIRAQDMVVGKDVREPEFFDVARVANDGAGLVTDLGLGKDDSDLHRRSALLDSSQGREPCLHFGDAIEGIDLEHRRLDINVPPAGERRA